MIRSELNQYKLGWFIGNFEPAVLSTGDFEVAVKVFNKGDKEPVHYQEKAVEVTVVVSGTCRIAGELVHAGEIIRLEPFEAAAFEAVTDCVLVAVKSPSLPGDKILGHV